MGEECPGKRLKGLDIKGIKQVLPSAFAKVLGGKEKPRPAPFQRCWVEVR